MDRIQYIPPPREAPGRHLVLILASFAFHAVMLAVLLAVTIYYRLHMPPPSGSAPGAPTITMQMMVITDSPTVTPPTPTPDLQVPVPEVQVTSPQMTMAPTKLPDVGIPVLPMRSTESHETKKPVRPKTASSAKPSAAPVMSSYALGVNILSHPPYPPDARAKGQSGTVVLNVRFNAAGDVVRVDISESSGVESLDSEARGYARSHWHCADYAGQTVSQPVQFVLEGR